MIFRDDKHKRFYLQQWKLSGVSQYDTEHLALFYVLGICRETRDHFADCYNMDRGTIQQNCLRRSWQTGSTRHACQLAFGLFSPMAKPLDIASVFGESELYRYFLQGLYIRFGEFRARAESTGRPTKYDDTTANVVKNMREDGMTIRAIAEKMEMSTTTVSKLLKK